ncbi:NAD-dependent protein deacetylase sirtuin-1-like isoform X1 [Acipenser ruthenus]|uniref:NAD-dependent protein deacetylase sirtuin-1-like isoform X1 n=1 Tax=Acipenser ruthenus TaxID=7906 RepID=UPI00145A4D5B|nr:NAD-dependent protein deacetylase sirtuin-1-like isoform X1 [Acipenser ruthenus]
MADGTKIILNSSAGGLEAEEPLSKRLKLGEVLKSGDMAFSEEQEMGKIGGESGAAAEKQRPGEGVQGQASAVSGGDNGLQDSELREGLVVVEEEEERKRKDLNGVSDTEQSDGTPQNEDILLNGFDSYDCDEDDTSSHASSSDWTPQPQIGSYSFIQQHIMRETDPRTILKDLLPGTVLPPDLDDMTLWQIVINISEPPKRKKRKDINTMEDVVRLLQECKKIMVLTGAGVSVSCGIPDFRSRDGIYARLAIDFPDLPDPQAMFDIEYFRKDPRPFFKFAKEIYPGQFQPSPCHRFIAMLDKQAKLLQNYTQNIDTLEQVAGVQRIIQCHGSFATASCLTCKYKVDSEAVREDIFNQVVPRCPKCPPDLPLAIMKPDIVFFGENLPEQFHRGMKHDKDEVDLLIVIGSSLKVRPVALIPNSIPHEVPQILINREQLHHLNFDVELLGDCDVIINELCHRLGGDYEQLCYNPLRLSEITEKPPRAIKESKLQFTDLPPTPLELTEDFSSLEQTSEHTQTSKQASEETAGAQQSNHLGSASELPQASSIENPPQNRTEIVEGNAKTAIGDLQTSKNEECPEPYENKSDLEILRRCWLSRFAKEPISKRLDNSQYLFQAPNHYIFHGAEVYSNSEDESSSSCVSHSDNESCCSPGEEGEDDSEGEEFYGRVEEEDLDNEDCFRDGREELEAETNDFIDMLRNQKDNKPEDIKNVTQM